MGKPIHLSSVQEAFLDRAAFPLPEPDQRLLRERVLARLEAVSELGDGTIFRTCRAVQRELWEPPANELRYRTGLPNHIRKLRG
jgi:hypothetical protein